MESEKQPSRYQFTFTSGEFNSYYFTTDTDIVYEIKFIPSTDFFGAYPELDVDIFEMTISVADNPTGKRLPADPMVPPQSSPFLNTSFYPTGRPLSLSTIHRTGANRRGFASLVCGFIPRQAA